MSQLEHLPVSELSAADADFRTAITALEHEFAAMFAQVRAQIRERAAEVYPGLSPAGYHVLQFLVRSGPRHSRALVEHFGWDKGAMSRLVKQLTKYGLVERQPDPDDGRACFLVASEVATARIDAVSSAYRRKIRNTLAGWDVAEVQQLTTFLHRLNTEV